MKISCLIITIGLMPLLVLQCNTFKTQKQTQFGISYSKVSPEQVEPFDIVVLEPDNYTHKEVEALKETDTEVIGYLSLGEVNPSRWYYPLLEMRGFLGKNENWDSYYLNLSDSTTKSIITDYVAPEIMVKGFEGFFLDTIDAVAPYTTRDTLQEDMYNVIENLRNRFPESRIIQNAGLFLLERTNSLVDGVALENVATLYDFKSESYIIRNDREYTERVELIRSYGQKYDNTFYIIDFAINPRERRDVAQKLDTLQYSYYIGNIELDSLYHPPMTVQ